MNKKGFTLTEVMAIIAIIAIIVLIAVPSIIAINKNMNKRIYEEKKDTIVSAAEIYANNNPQIFDDGDTVRVYVYELIENGYLSKDVDNNTSNCKALDNGNNGCIVNPVDKVSMNNEYVIINKKNVGVEVIYGGGTAEEEIITGTLVEQVCKKLENGSLVGKYGNGSKDYCLCGIDSKGLYQANKASNGSLQRTSVTVNACIISGDDVNNYLRYNGVMWRVLGVYNIYDNPNKLVAKIITDELANN